MKQRPRIYYTDSQKALMWERWRRGDSPQKIAQLFDRNHSSVIRIWRKQVASVQPKDAVLDWRSRLLSVKRYRGQS